jgi:hypothetical protein
VVGVEGEVAVTKEYPSSLEGVEQALAGISEHHKETEEEAVETLVPREETQGEVVGIMHHEKEEEVVEDPLWRLRFSGKFSVMHDIRASQY